MLRLLTARTVGLFVLASGVMLIVAACGGSSTGADPSGTPPSQNEPVATATPTPVAAPAAIQTPAPYPVDTPNDDLVPRGKLIFEKTAGGVGCATCHGLDALGMSEFAAPANIGATEDQIWGALQDRSQMSFIKLTDDEIKAVAGYLKALDSQP